MELMNLTTTFGSNPNTMKKAQLTHILSETGATNVDFPIREKNAIVDTFANVDFSEYNLSDYKDEGHVKNLAASDFERRMQTWTSSTIQDYHHFQQRLKETIRHSLTKHNPYNAYLGLQSLKAGMNIDKYL